MFYTINEASEKIGINRRIIYYFLNFGKIQGAFKIRRNWRITEGGLNEIIELGRRNKKFFNK